MPDGGPSGAARGIGLFATPALRVAAAPVALAILVLLILWSRGDLVTTGDEPHYLVMADGLVQDRTFDLRSAYSREAESQRIYGSPLPGPHVVIVNHRWGPYHQPGLAMLLAVPFSVAGILGSRIALCLFAALLPLVCFWFLRGRTSDANAAWLTAGFTVAMPIVFGAGQIYPDLPAGVVATALLLWLLSRSGERTTTGGWALFWLTTGLLAWLNLKFLATTGALVVAALLVSWHRERRVLSREAALALPLVALGPAMLAAFNIWAFANPLGPRPITEMSALFGRGASIFLGLHLDQGQGMFLQQPLLLAGVAALVPFARRRPLFVLAWFGVYMSLVLPNSLELARYGGGGPAGRFGWSAAWLWVVPVGYALEDAPGRWQKLIKPVAIACLAYQALLATRWIDDPHILFPRLEEDLTRRNSLFPVPLRAWLPSFYFWDFSSYWTYPPNVVAYALLGLLAIGGGIADRSRAFR